MDVTITLSAPLADALWTALQSAKLAPSSTPQATAPSSPAPTGVSAAPAPAPAAVAPVTWPQYIKVKNGTTIAALAPLNPEYISTMNSWIFGHMPGTFVYDPSAGHRSQAGLPLTAGGKVMMGEATFDTDAQALAWAAANDPNAPPSPQAQADWQAVWARMAQPTAAAAGAIDHPAPSPSVGTSIAEAPGNAPLV